MTNNKGYNQHSRKPKLKPLPGRELTRAKIDALEDLYPGIPRFKIVRMLKISDVAYSEAIGYPRKKERNTKARYKEDQVRTARR